MLESTFDFVVRNQTLIWLIAGIAISVALFLFVLPRTLGRMLISIALSNAVMVASLQNRPSPRFPNLIVLAIVFILGVVSLPAAAGIYAWISDAQYISNTALLDPPVLARPPVRPDAKEAIVLFHGWTGDSAHSFSSLKDLMLADPALSKVDIWPVDYPTYISRRHLNLSELSFWLYTDFVVPKLLPKYEKVYLVGHSLGGVVARDIFMKNILGRKDSPIVMLISLGSPFAGAPLATMAGAMGVRASYLAEVAPDSEYLRVLDSNWTAVGEKPLTLCLWSPVDGIVSHHSATRLCECEKPFPQWTHTELQKPANFDDLRYRTPIGFVLRHMSPTQQAARCD